MAGWFCPGCGAGPLDPGAEVIDHLGDCDSIDAAGRPVTAYATVLVVMPAVDAEGFVEEVMAGGQAVYFAGHLPGVTPDAVAAGADPTSWPGQA
jgi:hypothetical protein